MYLKKIEILNMYMFCTECYSVRSRNPSLFLSLLLLQRCSPNFARNYITITKILRYEIVRYERLSGKENFSIF